MCCSSGGQQEHPKCKVRHLQTACFYNAEEKRAKKQKQLQLLLQTTNLEIGAVPRPQANERTFSKLRFNQDIPLKGQVHGLAHAY